MTRQQQELDAFRQWLTLAEDRISRMADMGSSKSDLERYKQLLGQFEEDLKQQSPLTAASNFVVVVDDNSENGMCSR